MRTPVIKDSRKEEHDSGNTKPASPEEGLRELDCARSGEAPGRMSQGTGRKAQGPEENEARKRENKQSIVRTARAGNEGHLPLSV